MRGEMIEKVKSLLQKPNSPETLAIVARCKVSCRNWSIFCLAEGAGGKARMKLKEIAAKYEGKILVSWEGYEDKAKTIPKFSHRHLVADWLRKNGYTVVELEPITRKRKILG